MLGKINKNVPATWFLLVLFAVFAAQVLLNVNRFLVPDSVFFEYAEKAASLRNLQWPEPFLHPPLYPALIAFAATMMPGNHAEIYAAEALGVVSALLALWLLWRIVRRFARSSAPWVVWIWAFHASTLRMALKPKPEMVFTFFLLWAFERYLRGDRRAYLIAFFAALVQYEGILAVLAFFVADCFFARDKKRALVLTIASSTLIALWIFFQGMNGSDLGYRYYFPGWPFNLNFIYRFLSEMFGFLPISWFIIWVVLAAFLFVWGLITLWRHDSRSTLVLGVFLFLFVTYHVIRPSSGPDCVGVAAWVALIFLAHGVSQVCWWVRDHMRRSPLLNTCHEHRGRNLMVALFVLAATVYLLILNRSSYPQYRPSLVWMLAIVAPLLFFHWPRFRSRNLTTFCVAVSVMIFLAFHINSRTRNVLFETYYAKAEFRRVGEWYDKNFISGNRLLVSQPHIVAYYTRLNPRQDFYRLADAPPLSPEEFHAWLRKERISHVAWLSYNQKAQTHGTVWESGNKKRQFEMIAFLADGVTVPGFSLMESIQEGPRYAFIYRVNKVY